MHDAEDRFVRLEAALAAQQRQIDEQRRRIDDLQGENAALRRTAAGGPAPAGRSAPGEGDTGVVGRRTLLRSGLAASAAAAGGVLLLDGSPAAATDGQPLLVGLTNTASATTRLEGGSFYAEAAGPALGAMSTGGVSLSLRTPFGNGFPTISLTCDSVTATGVEVTTRGGTGVEATVGLGNQSSIGVDATCANGTGVKGTSQTWYGVHGVAPAGTGVVGSGPTGVSGIASLAGGAGVFGGNSVAGATGSGVLGASTSGTGVTATSQTGTALKAASTSGTALRLEGRVPVDIAPQTGPPTTGAHTAGRLWMEGDSATGTMWLCVGSGTPGVWRKLAGSGTSGALHVLPSPARVYDSRPGSAPTTIGPKTRFAANETRTFDLTANSSGVPAGATAALVTLLLVNASSTPGNLTIWANGVSKPLANTMVWGGTAARFTATATTALDSLARVQVNASQPTDLVLDVVGYYR